MTAMLWTTPMYAVLLGLLCGAAGFRIGWRTRSRLGLPLVQAAAGFAAFAASWRMGGAPWGAVAVGAWALGGTLVSLGPFRRDPERADRLVFGAGPYREEMFRWLETGRGPESRPLATTGAHLRELALYLAAALTTANFLSILLGAVLLNKMNAYVAALFQRARRRWMVRLLAWNSWSLIRVAAYVMLGSACAAPLARLAGYPAPVGSVTVPAVAGTAGVVLDLVLKLLLSRPCGRVLASAVHAGGPFVSRAGSEPPGTRTNGRA